MRRHHAKVLLLSEACRTEAQIFQETQYVDSFMITTARQNVSQSLVHITDIAYTFIQHLTQQVLTLQTTHTLMKEGGKVHELVLKQLSDDVQLCAEFHAMLYAECDFDDLDSNRKTLLDELYFEIVSLFSRVMLKQLRKVFCQRCARRNLRIGNP